MDAAENRVGYEQARRLRTTMEAAAIDRGDLWLYYFSIGGTVSEFEVDAYVNHSMLLPSLQRDLLSQAANEILAERTPPAAPFTADLLASDQLEDQGVDLEGPSSADEDGQQVDREG